MTIRPNLDMPGASMAFFATPTAAQLGHEDGHRVTLWPEAPDWHARAACRDSDVDFFPTRGDNEGVEACRATCAACPVRVDCLEYALAATPIMIGIWGGTSEKERRKIRRQRLKAAAA